jgi:hypothetical protein
MKLHSDFPLSRHIRQYNMDGAYGGVNAIFGTHDASAVSFSLFSGYHRFLPWLV